MYWGVRCPLQISGTMMVRKQRHLRHQSTLSGPLLLRSLLLFSTMEDNDNGAQQPWAPLISVLLCLALFHYHSLVLSYELSLASLSGYSLHISFSLPRITVCLTRRLGQEGGEVLGLKLFKLLAESVTIDEHKCMGPPFTRCLFIDSTGSSAKATAQTISCPFSDCKKEVLTSFNAEKEAPPTHYF